MTEDLPPEPSTIAQRLTAIEDRLAIYNLIASHPPIIDTQDVGMMKAMFASGGEFDRGPHGCVLVEELPDQADPAMVNAAEDLGLCHLGGMPYIKLKDGAAVAISYVALTVGEPFGPTFPVPDHGESKGHRIFRVTANRWDLIKQNRQWLIKRRTLVVFDGSSPARELIFSALHE